MAYRTLALICALFTLAATSSSASEHQLSNVGVFFVGGGVDESAGQHVGQALVHFFKSDTASATPVILYPGLGLTSSIFISTPDGRSGWAQQMALAGHPTYVYDPVNSGPSGMPAGVFDADPPTNIVSWKVDEVWPRFGFGASSDMPYENVRFPVEHIDQFYASMQPRILSQPRQEEGTAGRRFGPSAADVEALIELLERTGPAVLVPHSFAGITMFEVANSRPDLVKAIVVIEPVGCPRTADRVEPWSHAPFLGVYGDYIESRNQGGRLKACRTTAELKTEAGGKGEMFELTEQGVFGNTHMLMQDNNSADIGARIIAWIQTNVD